MAAARAIRSITIALVLKPRLLRARRPLHRCRTARRRCCRRVDRRALTLAVAERLGIPRRITVVLEGEGLVNDATALILFNVALVAELTGQFSVVTAARDFVFVLIGETAWGWIVGFTLLHCRHWAREPRIE